MPDAVALPVARSRAHDFVALAKPRLNFLVVASALAGYAMAAGNTADVVLLLSTLVGTGFVAGGASAFNQVIERNYDALMRRTRMRPLPDHRLQPRESLVFATVISLAGVLLLWVGANPLSAIVAFTTLITSAVIYTPLKRVSSFATVVGAIPGAL